MNRKIIVAIALLWIATGCVKEEIPSGLILTEEIATKDSTYLITSIPAAQTKKILIEEATGVRCTNCPSGAQLVKDLSTLHSNRIVSAAVYTPFLNDFHSPSTHDFNTQDALDLVTFIEGGDVSKPTAAIDRKATGSVSNPYFFPKENWSAQVDQLLLTSTPVNIELTSTQSGDNYYLKTTATFTDTITAPLAISVYLLEDSIIDMQLNNGVEILNYVHNHVLVDVLTPISGSTFLNDIATKEKGRVFERTFVFTLPTNVVHKEHCKLLAFVHKTGSEKTVLQAAEIHLQ